MSAYEAMTARKPLPVLTSANVWTLNSGEPLDAALVRESGTYRDGKRVVPIVSTGRNGRRRSRIHESSKQATALLEANGYDRFGNARQAPYGPHVDECTERWVTETGVVLTTAERDYLLDRATLASVDSEDFYTDLMSERPDGLTVSGAVRAFDITPNPDKGSKGDTTQCRRQGDQRTLAFGRAIGGVMLGTSNLNGRIRWAYGPHRCELPNGVRGSRIANGKRAAGVPKPTARKYNGSTMTAADRKWSQRKREAGWSDEAIAKGIAERQAKRNLSADTPTPAELAHGKRAVASAGL